MTSRHAHSPLAIPTTKPFDATVEVPGSKSLTNRALMIAAMAHGTTTLRRPLESDDTRYMRIACEKLGARFQDRLDSIVISGTGHDLQPIDEPLYIENAGTAARFLTSVLTTGKGPYQLIGNDRMHQRPIGDLVEALHNFGAKLDHITTEGFLPIRIHGGFKEGGRLQIRCEKSSQYLSGLLLMAPLLNGSTTITIQGSLVSRSYIEMTIQVMAAFGVHVEWQDSNRLSISASQSYQACTFSVEPDASSASYFFAAAAITRGRVRVPGLKRDSTQGDLGLVHALEKMGCNVVFHNDAVEVLGTDRLLAVDIDMNTMSDVAPTLAAVACFASGTTRIYNAANMRIKECDRIAAMAAELRKKGAVIEEQPDGWLITGGHLHDRAVAFDTYDDHRMAMALSLIGLNSPEVSVKNPACVSKTFPHYFEMLFEAIGSRS